MRQTFPPGKYFFGDPCYIMDDVIYDENWGKQYGFQDGNYYVEGKGDYSVGGTAYGDGCYQGVKKEYGVDAGCLAVVHKNLWGKDKLARKDELGTVFTVKKSAVFTFNDGMFTLTVDGKPFEHVNTRDIDDGGDEDADE